MANIPTSRIRIWDLPTRLFHWTLVLCVVGLFVTGTIGGELIEPHMYLGYAVFTLLLFRIVWGFIGGRWSRFSQFIHGPGTVLRYLRGQGDAVHDLGHNPLGAGSVIAMLVVLAAQVATGLFADDEIATTGPLAKYISTETSLMLTGYHRDFGKWLLVALVSLHVLAILYYRVVRKRSLVPAMIHGDKLLANPSLAAPTLSAADNRGTRAMALVVVALCVAVVAWVVKL